VRTLSALRLTTTLAVGAGVLGLYLAGLLGAVGLGFAGLALVAGWWLQERITPSRRVAALITAVIALAAALDLLYLSTVVFDAFVRLLVLLVLLRLVTARRPRDLRDAGMLAFFMPVASSAVTVSVDFVFVLVAYVLASMTMLVLAHDLGEAERAGADAAALAELRTGPGVVLIGVAGSVVAAGVTLALFFVIPRVGEATLAFRNPSQRMLIGFSDRVELGTIGQLETDATVAMRVHLPAGPPPPTLLPHIRWRGVALERYDGTAWSTDRPRGRAVRSFGGGSLEVQPVRGPGTYLQQAIFLEPIGAEAIFAAPHAVRLWARNGVAVVDEAGAISVPTPSARLQYGVDSLVGPGPWGGRLDADARARHLQLPPLPPRIAALAREVTAGTRTQAQAAQALTVFLSRDFRYTLTLERRTDLDPLEEFLFVRRSGNCEYFSAALAVMLRTLGVPARVVNGFQRGEWNPYGEYFLVRMGDAHSWVEAHVDGAGWITLDPSPRGEGGLEPATASVSLWLDAVRVRWYRYIVGWSRQDQVQAAVALQRVATRPWRLPWRDLAVPAGAAAAGLVAAAVVAWVAWRRLAAWGPARAAVSRPPDFYRRALRVLARAGLRPAPSETAREFAARVADSAPAATEAMRGLTASYEAVRFGGQTPDARAMEAVRALRAALRRG